QRRVLRLEFESGNLIRGRPQRRPDQEPGKLFPGVIIDKHDTAKVHDRTIRHPIPCRQRRQERIPIQRLAQAPHEGGFELAPCHSERKGASIPPWYAEEAFVETPAKTT